MKLNKLTSGILAIVMTATSIPSVTAEEYLSVCDINEGEAIPAEDFGYKVNEDRKRVTITGYNDDESYVIFTAGDFMYTLNEDGESVTIYEYIGDGGDVVIPAEIEGKNVTEIRNYAFASCTSITSVAIPNSVIVIGDSAFAFCTSLTSVELPNSVTNIGDYAFSSCTSLTSVGIPISVTEIGCRAFLGCTSLKSIDVDEKNGYYSSVDGVLLNKNKASLIIYPVGKTDKGYSIPNSVTEIEDYAFENCSSLTSVEIPNSVMEIGYGAFCYCTSLSLLEIPNSVTKIKSLAFYKCTSLTSVEIPNSVTEIGDSAFGDCTSLASVIIPDSVTVIGDFAFVGCISLKYINVDEKNTDYSSIDGVLFDKNKTRLIQYPACKTDKSYSIPNGVIEIGSYAFVSSTSLVYLEIPDSVTHIGGMAFYSCISLISAEIPNNVIHIGGMAFCGCTSLTSIEIPNSVTYIGEGAFLNCTSLVVVVVLSTEAFFDDDNFMGIYIFDSNSSLTIYGYESSTAQTYAERKRISFKIIDKEAAIDHKNGIIIENPNLEGKTFVVAKSDKSTNSEVTLNITLKDENGNEVQPEGEVTVKIPLPEGWDAEKTTVSRRENDGTLIDMKAVCENGYMVFVTDHFSEYILSRVLDVKIADLNNDGKITTVDAKWVLQAVSGSRKLTPEQEAAADVNSDGKISTVDAKWILQAVSGSRVPG